jgi:hypothetical protein
MTLTASSYLPWRLDVGTDTRGPADGDFPPLEVGQTRRIDVAVSLPSGATLAALALVGKANEADPDVSAKILASATIDDSGASGTARAHFLFTPDDLPDTLPTSLYGEALGELAGGEVGPCWRGTIPVPRARLTAMPTAAGAGTLGEQLAAAGVQVVSFNPRSSGALALTGTNVTSFTPESEFADGFGAMTASGTPQWNATTKLLDMTAGGYLAQTVAAPGNVLGNRCGFLVVASCQTADTSGTYGPMHVGDPASEGSTYCGVVNKDGVWAVKVHRTNSDYLVKSDRPVVAGEVVAVAFGHDGYEPYIYTSGGSRVIASLPFTDTSAKTGQMNAGGGACVVRLGAIQFNNQTPCKVAYAGVARGGVIITPAVFAVFEAYAAAVFGAAMDARARLLAVGDSRTSCVGFNGVAAGQDWPTLTASHFAAAMLTRNHGVGGTTTAYGNGFLLDSISLPTEPPSRAGGPTRIAYLGWGVNDKTGSFNTAPEDSATQLADMADRLYDAGFTHVVVQPTLYRAPGDTTVNSWEDRQRTALQAFATAGRFYLYDLRTRIPAYALPALMNDATRIGGDGLHYTAAACAEIATDFAAYLKTITTLT